jgi:hypothetical protein
LFHEEIYNRFLFEGQFDRTNARGADAFGESQHDVLRLTGAILTDRDVGGRSLSGHKR